MVMGMDGFRLRCGPEQPCSLGITLLLRLGRKGQVLAVGLRFAREGLPHLNGLSPFRFI